MRNKTFQKVFTLINGLVILAFIISGCAHNSSILPGQTAYKGEPHWFVDSNGHFHTNDVELAQKEIPFTIVVPNYTPDLLGSDYLYEISGPFENTLSNYIEVKIQYWKENHQIYISEYNKRVVLLPTDELEPIDYEIVGATVLRQETGFITSSGTIEGLSFNWNTVGFTYRVEIYGIPEEEGIKIVESMIKQLE